MGDDLDLLDLNLGIFLLQLLDQAVGGNALGAKDGFVVGDFHGTSFRVWIKQVGDGAPISD
jgi:hypothetical protein